VQPATEPAPAVDDGMAPDGAGDGVVGDAVSLGDAVTGAFADADAGVEGEVCGDPGELEGVEIEASDAAGDDVPWLIHPPTSSAAPVTSGRNRDRADRTCRGRTHRGRGTPGA
jgi:hypothetical protein